MILIPEVHNEEVQKFMEMDHGMDIRFEDKGLLQSINMLKDGEVDALVVGVSESSADVIRGGIRLLGCTDGYASSFFLMRNPNTDEEIFFADCAVNVAPTPSQLARIAKQTCQSAIALGHEPVVAFLSFSTEGSAKHQKVDEVNEAKALFDEVNPGIQTYGDIQFDAAFNKSVYNKKTGMTMHKTPNVFIFPDLNSGNIGYKICERMAGYIAIGPILQGFNRPLYDLSRGADAMTIMEVCKTVTKLLERK